VARVIRSLKQTYDACRFIRENRRDPYRILISCLLSLRTRDETTFPATERLFSLASRPREMAALPVGKISRAIFPVGFYRTKAERIREISRLLVDRHGGTVPDDRDSLLALPGVGRKTANLVLGKGFHRPAICVDTHVHRISNRLGWVDTDTPEQTEQALERLLQRRDWIDINELLVRHGQTVCHPTSPVCSKCDISRDCRRRGVTRSR
jgi:endonuclease-3